MIEAVEVKESPTIASTLIRSRFILDIIKQIAFPLLIFFADFGIVAYTLWNPDQLRIIACGIFFSFSILFLFCSKRLWRD